ncbi:MAG: hypothetical protein ABJM06_07495 [Gilvibacter sp.]
MTETTADNGKTVAILSYITIIGWIIALVMHNGNKTKLGGFHIRQTLGIMLLYIANYILWMVLTIWLLYIIIGLAIFVLWVLGLVGAIQGEEKPVPLLGAQFQDWFKSVA